MTTAESTVDLKLGMVVIPVADIEASTAADRDMAEVEHVVPSA